MDIQIRVADGTVMHKHILGHEIEDQVLKVSTALGDIISYSPSYWRAYVVNPKGDGVLDV